MEVKLDKRYPVPAGVEHAWTVLSDVHATAACMPGARITDRIDDTHYKGTVRSKVGPAVMVFQGEIEVLALDAGRRQLQMVGKGADKSGSSASMDLTARVEPDAEGGAVLAGQAVIVVAGKLAQFGSRLLVPVSDAMLSQFADNFRAAAEAAAAASVTVGDGGAEAGDAPAAPSEIGGAAIPATANAADSATATGASPMAAPAGTANRASAPPTAVPAQPHGELNALSLLWLVIKRWFAGLFGRAR